MTRSTCHTTLALIAEAFAPAADCGLVLGILPSLSAPLPKLHRWQDGHWYLLSACGEQLAGPLVERILELLGRPLPGAATRPDALHTRLVGLALEAGYEGLDGSSTIALTLVHHARAAIGVGAGLLSGLEAEHKAALRALSRELSAMSPAALGACLLPLGQGLSASVQRARSEAERLGARADGLGLANELLDQGLLLMPERLIAEQGAGTRAVDTRRYRLGEVLLDRLVLLDVGSDGRLLGSFGPLPKDAASRLLLPRGERPVVAFVVALRLDALAGRLESSPVSGRAPALIGAAWSQLIADAPEALHQRVGCLGLSVFLSGLDAIAFAERSTRTLSGPRFLDSGAAAPAFEVESDVRVSAGVSWGLIQGGSDGHVVRLEGQVVGRALALAAHRPAMSATVRRLGRESGGGVSVDVNSADAIMAEALEQGRFVVGPGTLHAQGGVSFACRGVFQALGRQLVLVGEATSVLVSVEEGTFRDQSTLLATEDDSEPIVEMAHRTRAARRPTRADWMAADPLSTGELLGDEVVSNDRGSVEAEASDAMQPVEFLWDVDSVIAEMEVENGSPGPAQAASGAAGGDDAREVPAWDATGLSLPDYTQEFSADEAFAQLDAQEDPHSYSLEVDDDYGFEGDDLVRPPFAKGRDPSSPRAPSTPAMAMRSILPEDLDIFALPGPSERAVVGKARPSTRSAVAEPPRRPSLVAPTLASGPPSGSPLGPSFPVAGGAEVTIEDEDASDALRPVRQVVPEETEREGLTTRPAASTPPPATGSAPVRRPSASIPGRDLANLFVGYVVFADGGGGYTFGLRDGNTVRDAHSYETLGDTEAAYRAFLQAKVAEGLVPRLDLWSPLPSGARLEALDSNLLQRAYQAMVNS